MGTTILIFCGVIFILGLVGTLISLPVLLPPLRQLGRHSLAMRVTLIFLMSLISFMITFAALTYLTAAVELTVYGLVRRDYITAEIQQHNRAVVHELWLRQMLPPLRVEACYTGQSAVCDLADEINPFNQWYSYMGMVGLSLIPAGTTAILVWLYTRPRLRF